ncbi:MULTISPECIES: outer membrane beta-barrel protein [Dysgonomonas]|uniref:outer membrane beta-barrel protein n=1 Tax=Dysgonomonas TaxID=156973 RepID=UPI00188485A6|nr:outer membrane beta-barrel protein [Dysgonomonas sp. GY75]MBF0648328.1 porin family protein [Dysgonomonas sp. GY75]
MKKLLLVLVLAGLSIGAFSQSGSKSVLVKAGYQSDYERFGLGVEGRYSITNNLRLAPDFTFYFPNNHLTGLDFNANIHYVFPIQSGFSLYPLAGVAMVNNRLSIGGYSDSSTDFGVNIGAGGSFDIGNNGYLNVEFKYSFQDVDNANIMLGYGVRF